MTSTQPFSTNPVPQPQPPITPVQLNLFGNLYYPPGPYGSKRPIRHRGAVIVFEGLIVSRHRNPRPLPNLTGFKDEQVLMQWGDIVTLKKGPLLSSEIFTDRDGYFTFVTKPITSPIVGMVLEIRDYNPVSWNDGIPKCIYELIPGPVDLNFPSSQGVGKFQVPWQPTPWMTYLASINGERYFDHQKLTRKLCGFVRKPTYPFKIVLSRESAMGQSVQNGTVGEDYTAGEQLVAELGKNTPGPDFAAKLVAELRKFPRLALVRGSGSEAIANILENLITVNIYQLEHESLVLSFVEAINKLMGSPVWIPRDPDDVVEEQAAVCVFLAIVGALAAGGAKVNIQLKNDMRSNDQKMLAIEITLTK